MKTMIALTLSLFLASCMHLGMMGTHGDQQSQDHQTIPEPVLEKEIVIGDVKATATFLPLQVGEEVIFTLKLVDKPTSQPVSNAKIYFHTFFLHAAEKRHINTIHGESDSSHMLLSPEHDMNFDQEVEESAPGIYVVGFTPSQSGEYKTMFHIRALGGQELEPEVVIETTRHAVASGETHGGMRMHRTGGMPEYVIIGGVVMAAAMIAFWAGSGGHMF